MILLYNTIKHLAGKTLTAMQKNETPLKVSSERTSSRDFNSCCYTIKYYEIPYKFSSIILHNPCVYVGLDSAEECKMMQW